MYNILIRTSWAFGGATSTSSSFRGSPGPQQTAALQVMVFPTVSAMAEVMNEIWAGSESVVVTIERGAKVNTFNQWSASGFTEFLGLKALPVFHKVHEYHPV